MVQLNIWVNGQAVLGSSAARELVVDVRVGTSEVVVYFGRTAGAANVPGYVVYTLTAAPSGG